jgi:hypothetical protein
VNCGVVNPRSQARPIVEMGPITLNTLFALRSLSCIDHLPDPGASAAARGRARGDSLLAGYFINSEGRVVALKQQDVTRSVSACGTTAAENVPRPVPRPDAPAESPYLSNSDQHQNLHWTILHDMALVSERGGDGVEIWAVRAGDPPPVAPAQAFIGIVAMVALPLSTSPRSDATPKRRWLSRRRSWSPRTTRSSA